MVPPLAPATRGHAYSPCRFAASARRAIITLLRPAGALPYLCGTMDYAGRGGWIEVVSGVMFSGKSEELLRRVRRALLAKKRVQVFKSHLDERYGGLQVVRDRKSVV